MRGIKMSTHVTRMWDHFIAFSNAYDPKKSQTFPVFYAECVLREDETAQKAGFRCPAAHFAKQFGARKPSFSGFFQP